MIQHSFKVNLRIQQLKTSLKAYAVVGVIKCNTLWCDGMLFNALQCAKHCYCYAVQR